MATRVAVVGAGMAGLATSVAIAGRADVTLFEARANAGGRAETRRREGCTYETGANYLTDADDRVRTLLTEGLPDEGLVELGEPVHTFDGEGTIRPGREDTDRRLTYEGGLDTLAELLLGASGATLQTRTRVDHLSRVDGNWLVHTADDEEPAGPFEAVVLAAPAPQTADLLGQSAWEHVDRRRVREGVERNGFRAVLSAVLHYDAPLDRPYYALVNTDDTHDVGWVAREAAKPGYVPDGEAVLLVQMAPDWSAKHFGDAAPTVVDAAAEKVATLLEDPRLATPDWTDHRRWRYALPSEGLDPAVAERAREHDLFLAGDWVRGEARLHAALRSGLETGERVADRL